MIGMILQEQIFWTFFIITMIIVGVILFILYIKLLIWVYGDAQKRNMDEILWLLIVIFTGLVGLIIYLFIRDPLIAEKTEQPPKPKAVEERDVKYCSACGSPVNEKADFCSLCGE